jgi:hypothetical protein
MLHTRRALAAVPVLLLLSAGSLAAEPFGVYDHPSFAPGDVLRATVNITPYAANIPDNADLFYYTVAFDTVSEPVGSITARLFDRGRLLGTYTGPATSIGLVAPFIAPGTSPPLPRGTRNPAVVDFSSLRNGTFNGEVDLTIGSGRITLFRPSDEFELDGPLGSTGARWGNGFEATSVDISPTPEPSPLLLLAVGAAIASIGWRRAKQKRATAQLAYMSAPIADAAMAACLGGASH